MRIIRENLFLVVVVGVVVVGGVIMLVVRSGTSEGVAGELKQRQRVKKDVKKLDLQSRSKGERVNGRTLAEVKRQVAAYKEKARVLGDLHVAWNAARYPVLRLPIWRGGSLLLTKSDVSDWNELIVLLRDQGGAHATGDDQKNMGRKLWESLPQKLRDELPKKGEKLGVRGSLKLLTALNATLKDVNFFQPSEYPNLSLPEEADRILRMRSAAEAKAKAKAKAKTTEASEGLPPPQGQRLNRLVLETLYPRLIAESHVAAFPIDGDLYQRHSLRFHFKEQYNETIADLLATLRPASPPTEDEILEETERWDKRIRRVAEDERRRRAAEAATETGEGGTRIRGMGEEERRMMPPSRRMPTGTRKGTRVSSGAVDANPKTLGRQSMLKRKAKTGWMYASPESFDMHFEDVPANPADAQLWWAQVNLWVTRDIVSAINKTNQDVLSGQAKDRRNVLHAAVKQLVAIELIDDEEQLAARKTKGRSDRGEAGLAMGNAEGFEAPGRRRPAKGSSKRKPVKELAPEAPTLTKRVRCGDFEVVDYRFSVVMPTRHVLRLQRNLLGLNYHTIMSVNMQPVDPDEYELHYYGTEPVMQVNIDAQLILLSSWIRGKWDEKANAWLVWQRDADASSATTRPAAYPSGKWAKAEPLMPVDVLKRRYVRKQLLKSKWSGLRKEDVDRVAKSLSTAGGVVSEPAGPGRRP